MSNGILFSQCSSCGAKNRLPVTKIGQPGKCGRCSDPLETRTFFAEEPVEITEGRFDLVTRLSPQPVLVDFWAPWCAPCKQEAPVLEELARELTGRLLVAKLNADQAQSTVARFGVQGIPTLVLLRSGIEVDRMTGALPLPALRSRVERFLG